MKRIPSAVMLGVLLAVTLGGLAQVRPAAPQLLRVDVHGRTGGGAGGGGGEEVIPWWIGIPDPASNHGYDALNVTEPADPASWAMDMETAGYYYVCPGQVGATDSGRTYGYYPNGPRATIPLSPTLATAGGKLVLCGDSNGELADWSSADGDEINVGGAGDETTQNWIVGRCSTYPDPCAPENRPVIDNASFRLDGDYQVWAHINVANYDVDTHSDRGVIEHTASFATVKHTDFGGDGANHGTGPRAYAPVADTVVYDLTCHDFGAWQDPSENDYHCIKPASSTASTRIWLLEVDGTRISGDTIQIGTANNNLGTGPSFIYIGGGVSFENGENAIDIKTSDDVIISGHKCWDMDMGTGSGGGACYSIHNAARRTWVLFNESWGQNDGIAVTQDSGNTTDGYIIGNVLHNHDDRAIVLRSAISPFWRVVNNSFANNEQNIELYPGQLMNATCNAFGDRRTSTSADWDINIQSSSGTAITDYTLDANVYENLRINNESSTVTSLATLQGLGLETNGRTGSPMYVDPTNADPEAVDLHPQAGSDLIDNCVEDSAYETFETLYGIDIRVDFDGNPLPADPNDWDVGAYEYTGALFPAANDDVFVDERRLAA
jgi:hypothetical protein